MGLLALIPIKDWCYGGLIVVLGIVGLHYHHKILAEGIAEQQAADAKATATLVAQTAKQTAELQAKATMAEQAYDKELQTIAAQPPVGTVRLCIAPHNNSGAIVRQTSGAKPGDASTGAGTSSVQSVSSGDSSGGPGTAGPDIGSLLSALANAADRSSATLREYQARAQ